MRQQRTLLLMPQVLVAQEQLSVQLQVLEVVLEVQQLVLVLVLVLVQQLVQEQQLLVQQWRHRKQQQL